MANTKKKAYVICDILAMLMSVAAIAKLGTIQKNNDKIRIFSWLFYIKIL